MKRYVCVDCGHEVHSNRVPRPINWNDGHICTFKCPEDIDTSKITPYEKLIEQLGKDCDISDGDFPEDDLRIAYDNEVTLMLRVALRARLPQVILHPFRKAGSQHIAEFEVKDLFIENDPSKINWHGQNTSQWLYAGCILYDERDNRVSRHH